MAKASTPAQVDKFREAARRLETDDREEAFDAALKRVAGVKQADEPMSLEVDELAWLRRLADHGDGMLVSESDLGIADRLAGRDLVALEHRENDKFYASTTPLGHREATRVR